MTKTAATAGSAYEVDRRIDDNQKRVFQAVGTTSSGAGSATILVQGSLDDTNWITLGTISLTLGTAATSDGFATDAPWLYIRGNCTAISGTGASVTLYAGI
jgi:hypothetical protein